MADPQRQDAPEMEPQREESRSMAMVSNALAIIGFIILIIIIVWGLLRIFGLATFSWDSIFGGAKVEITAPKNGTSGTPLPLSWKYTGDEIGTYSFLYQCSREIDLRTSSSGSNGVLTKIPCGSAISVGSSTAATVVPMHSSSNSVPLSVTVLFKSQDGETHAEAIATISIAPKSAATPVAPPTPEAPAAKPVVSKPSYAGKPAVALVPHAASGPADLQVRMITVGVMHPSGALINRMPTSPSDIIGVEFDIANVGGSATGSWYFSATLPTGGGTYPYHSPTQIPLAPGEHIVSVLRFSPNMRPGTITITADPSNIIREGNESNNMVTQNI